MRKNFCNRKNLFHYFKFYIPGRSPTNGAMMAPAFYEKVEFSKILFTAQGFSDTVESINNSQETSRSQPLRR